MPDTDHSSGEPRVLASIARYPGVARPSPVLRPRDESIANGVQVDVDRQPGQVSLVVDQLGHEAAPKERTDPAVASIELAGIRGSEPMHRLGEAAVGRANEQVIVVAHLRVRVHLDPVPRSESSQKPVEEPPIRVVAIDVGLRRSLIHDVVPRTLMVSPVSLVPHAAGRYDHPLTLRPCCGNDLARNATPGVAGVEAAERVHPWP